VIYFLHFFLSTSVQISVCLKFDALVIVTEKNQLSSFNNRLVRSGMWFICQKENLDLFLQYEEEVMNLYNEFFRFHPNNGLDVTMDYLVIKLSDEMVNKQLRHIRMRSYRWAGVKPVVEGLFQVEESFACPAYYMWFFDLIIHNLIPSIFLIMEIYISAAELPIS
jgi:hypothetical protein